MKKLAGIVLALVFTFGIATLAFAAETASPAPTAKAAVPQEIKDKKVQLEALFSTAKNIGEQIKSTQGKVKEEIAAIREKIKGMSKGEKAAAKENLKALFERPGYNKWIAGNNAGGIKFHGPHIGNL